MIIKSLADKREHAYETLENGVQVFVISDSTLTSASIAVSVRAGSYQDPSEKMGLAHFLEHLLFVSSRKYPDVEGFASFVKKNGGSYNAYTADQHTSYFLKIDTSFFSEAVDRLSQFFIAPLFSDEAIEKEISTVDTEYRGTITSEAHRFYAALKATANPLHPFSQFSVGNNTTLRGSDVQRTRSAVLEFYNKYYKADSINVVLAGPCSIDILMAQARMAFQGLEKPTAESAGVEEEPLVYTAEETGRTVYIQSQGETQWLSLYFYLNNIGKKNTNARLLIVDLLEIASPGSLSSLLKSEGLINYVSACMRDISTKQCELVLHFGPTSMTVEAFDRITEMSFSYFKLLEDTSFQCDMFERVKKRSARKFRFQENPSSEEHFLEIAENLHSLPAEKVLSYKYIMQDEGFDSDVFQGILSQLRPKNLCRVVTCQAGVYDKLEPYYNVPYRIEPFSDKQCIDWSTVSKNAQFYAPEENTYEPQEFSEKLVSTIVEEPVSTAVGVNLVWHAIDQRPNAPLSWARILLRSPHLFESAYTFALNLLWRHSFFKTLEVWIATLREIDTSVDIDIVEEGLIFKLDGYRETQKKIWPIFLEKWRDFFPTLEDFNNQKLELLRYLETSIRINSALEDLEEIGRSALFQNYWLAADLIPVLKTITWKEVDAHRRRVLQTGSLKAFFYGNITAEEASQAIAEVALNWNLEDRISEISEPVISIPTGHWYQAVPTHSAIHGSMVYMPSIGDSLEEQVRLQLLQKLLCTPFFNQLRIEERMGYIARADYLAGPRHKCGLVFKADSPQPGARISCQILNFIQNIEPLLRQLEVEEWNAVYTALIRDFEKPFTQPQEAQAHYWSYIIQGRAFSERTKMADILKAMTQASFATDIVNWLQRATIIVLDTGTTAPPGYSPWKRIAKGE